MFLAGRLRVFSLLTTKISIVFEGTLFLEHPHTLFKNQVCSFGGELQILIFLWTADIQTKANFHFINLASSKTFEWQASGFHFWWHYLPRFSLFLLRFSRFSWKKKKVSWFSVCLYDNFQRFRMIVFKILFASDSYFIGSCGDRSAGFLLTPFWKVSSPLAVVQHPE